MFWLLLEWKTQQIIIPKDYFLSKLIKKEGFDIKYPKPTDQLHGKESILGVTEWEFLVVASYQDTLKL